MTDAAILVPLLALIWAGVSLGGSLVAAPAKFRAPSLDRPTALEVGRAQFYWVGVTEGALCVGLIAALVVVAADAWRWMAVPITLFAIQRFVVMPPLDARTVQAIQGASARARHLHTIYVILELLKFGGLVTAGVAATSG